MSKIAVGLLIFVRGLWDTLTKSFIRKQQDGIHSITRNKKNTVIYFKASNNAKKEKMEKTIENLYSVATIIKFIQTEKI